MINKLKELLEAATPGPWIEDDQYITEHGFILASVGRLQNAQLIVAMRNCLPELLAVVDAAQLMGQAQSMYLESALAALAKKVGE